MAGNGKQAMWLAHIIIPRLLLANREKPGCASIPWARIWAQNNFWSAAFLFMAAKHKFLSSSLENRTKQESFKRKIWICRNKVRLESQRKGSGVALSVLVAEKATHTLDRDHILVETMHRNLMRPPLISSTVWMCHRMLGAILLRGCWRRIWHWTPAGGTPLYGLWGDVPLDRLWFLASLS